MKIVKGNPIPNPISSYKIVLEFMHGDADADTTEVLVIKEGSKQLLPFLEYVMNLSDERENEDFDFDYSTCEEEDDIFEFYYPRDATGGDSGPGASFEKYTVTYFDEKGIEHEVKLEK